MDEVIHILHVVIFLGLAFYKDYRRLALLLILSAFVHYSYDALFLNSFTYETAWKYYAIKSIIDSFFIVFIVYLMLDNDKTILTRFYAYQFILVWFNVGLNFLSVNESIAGESFIYDHYSFISHCLNILQVVLCSKVFYDKLEVFLYGNFDKVCAGDLFVDLAWSEDNTGGETC